MLRGDSTNHGGDQIGYDQCNGISLDVDNNNGCEKHQHFSDRPFGNPSISQNLRTVNYILSMTGWWFGTFFYFFHSVGIFIIPTDSYFSEGWPNHQMNM